VIIHSNSEVGKFKVGVRSEVEVEVWSGLRTEESGL